MLALPGYEKTDHGRYEIHSASPSDDAKFFGAIHTNETGNHTLIVGVNKDAVTHLLDSWMQSKTATHRSKPLTCNPIAR